MLGKCLCCFESPVNRDLLCWAIVIEVIDDSVLYLVYISNNHPSIHPHHFSNIRCVSTAKAIPKDKAIKRFSVRNIVDASALRDIREASAYDNYALPKLYIKQHYCIEAAVHQRIVRVRSSTDRRIRTAPQRGPRKF